MKLPRSRGVPRSVLAAALLAVLPATAVLTLHAAPDPAALTAQARGWLVRGDPAAALKTFQAAAWEPACQPADSAGVYAVAAALASERALARHGLATLARCHRLPAQALLAVTARNLHACNQPCAVPLPSADAVARAAPEVSARLLMGLATVAPQAARAAARAAWSAARFKDDAVPAPARAELLAGIHTALTAGEDRTLADSAERAAWELLPAEPALAFIIRGGDDGARLARWGSEAGVTHLEALADAHQGFAALSFAARLCRTTPLTSPADCQLVAEPLRCRVALAVGRAHRHLRHPEDAARVLHQVAEQCPALHERARFLEGRALGALRGRGADAVAALLKVPERHPASHLSDDALLLAADLSARLEDEPRARELWQAAASQPGADMAEDARWRLTWSDLDGQRRDAARVRLRAAWADQPFRARYWLARTELQADDQRAALHALINESPASVEAALARGRVGSAGTPSPFPTPTPITCGGAPSEDEVAARALLAAGLDDDAAALARQALRTLPEPRVACLTALLLAAGDAPTASQTARRRLWPPASPELSGATLSRMALAWPRAHEHALADAAKELAVPLPLLLAVAREESAFDARVKSAAGAVGLFQLLPATAMTEAMALRTPLTNELALLDPVVNARLAASYLARLLRRFRGAVVPAVAAYNIGPGTVHGWLQERPGQATDEFIERISVAETREYVRRVLLSLAVYTLMLTPQTPLVLPLLAIPPAADAGPR